MTARCARRWGAIVGLHQWSSIGEIQGPPVRHYRRPTSGPPLAAHQWPATDGPTSARCARRRRASVGSHQWATTEMLIGKLVALKRQVIWDGIDLN
jgi:hypothetical protein